MGKKVVLRVEGFELKRVGCAPRARDTLGVLMLAELLCLTTRFISSNPTANLLDLGPILATPETIALVRLD